ncbi:hypothetical protein SODALDRAFT_361415 [Sodiomyces alkalinus F11]|uniref:Uncharacterized protein n=1 Tax=Sodiomyces alkalinus (strain CBS 110278 / VKM F-3762 / F11) TaxID=1314773 RepID=A0A3N2PTP1_SODAK|nr:hypothetical protein SODALDRAFT_361415 [Sodiomyces alkalinus F11]ROT37686.1 hypothetical protein SODALDRAFT_361415 [Sodiomyces alkalinus F11]
MRTGPPLSLFFPQRMAPHSSQIQPPLLPRPDLSALGISYRRIPLLAINRDIYLDMRLISPKLESLFPHLPRLGEYSDSRPESYSLERLLSILTTETGLFPAAVRSPAFWAFWPRTIPASVFVDCTVPECRDRSEDPDGQAQDENLVAVKEGLKPGHEVQVWPTDTGSPHREVGKLIGLDKTKVVIEVVGPKVGHSRSTALRTTFQETNNPVRTESRPVLAWKTRQFD